MGDRDELPSTPAAELKTPSTPLWRPAASVCLLHRGSRHIMMGRRLVGPWPGYWAFPGGGVDAGETPLAAGLRELEEETGIRLAAAGLMPLLETEVRVSLGERRYAITNFVVEVEQRLAGHTTSELEPRWVEVEAAGQLKPMARGTETVLARVINWFES